MATPFPKTSFGAGELSPSVWGRVDLAKFHSGASTMRNFFVNFRGGASSRAGSAFVGQCKQLPPAPPPRDIRFQYNINQGYDLEFGNLYMRVKSNGGYVTEPTVAITGVSNADPCAISATGTPYANGDWVFLTGIGGTTQLNGQTYIVENSMSGSFTLTDLFGNAIDSTHFGTYTSGGSSARIFTLVTPWADVDLPWLKFTQDADVMSLCCLNQDTKTEYPPYDLARIAASDWTLTQTTFGASISPPTGVAVTAQSSDTVTTWYSYVVTAVSRDTAEESSESAIVSVQNNDISVFQGSNTITWNAVTGADSYNIYKATPSYGIDVSYAALFAYAGTSRGTSFTDKNITPDFTQVPPIHDDPFARGAILEIPPVAGGANYSQQTIGYSITTSTGTGFDGTPLVVNGQFAGFLIRNGGKNYKNTDTLTLTDSGGGVATGSYTFTGTPPTDGQTVVFNGESIKYVNKDNTLNAYQIYVQPTVALAIQELSNYLSASSDVALICATYTAFPTELVVTYNQSGTVGNAYTLGAGSYGGTVSGATLTGGGVAGSGGTGTIIVGPQTGTYPGVVSYFQQRRGYANTLNQPDTYFMSQPGAFKNFDSAIPISPSDAIIGTPWAQQVNGIQFMLPMQSGDIILTGNGAWQLSGGGGSTAITPADQDAQPQAYNGCSPRVPPIPINYDILYVQAKGSVVRDLTYNFFVNIFTGQDKTELSSHLFNNFQIEQWAYAEEPYKIVWAVRDDGILLSFTYLKDEDVYGWARHDTNGQFVSVVSVTEPPVDAIYVIVKRYVPGANKGVGAWVYYSERMDNRLWKSAEDTWCVDCGLSYPQNFPNASLTISPAQGVPTIQQPNISYGGANYSASTYARVTDLKNQGTGAVCTLTIVGGVVTNAVLSGTLTGYIMPNITVIDPTGLGGGAAIAVKSLYLATAVATSGVFSNTAGFGTVGDVIRSGGAIATVTAFTSSTTLAVSLNQPVTAVLQDDPNLTPISQASGSWSIINPTTTVSGLGHLEGMTVSILADGGVVSPQIVTNGEIILPVAASQIIVGLPFICQLQTLYFNAPGMNPTPEGRRKSIAGLTIRTDSSRGLCVGANQPDASATPGLVNVPWVVTPIAEMSPLIIAGQPIPLITGDSYAHPAPDWSVKGQVALQITDPVPANITMIVPEFTFGDTPNNP